MAADKFSLLNRLRRAVKKVKLLLNYSVNRWRVASVIGASSSKRRLSFKERPGLRACVEDEYYDDQSGSSGSGSSRSRPLCRTISCPSPEGANDIDSKADMFIANFYRQLRIERQVSLELHYCRGNSFNSMQSP